MNTLHLFLTFALIHAPFALAQTIQEKFEQLVSLSNQSEQKDITDSLITTNKSMNWDKLNSNLKTQESKNTKNNFLKINLENVNNFLAVSPSLKSMELIHKKDHTTAVLLKDLQPLNQQKEALKTKILEKTKPKPRFDSFHFELVAYSIYKQLI